MKKKKAAGSAAFSICGKEHANHEAEPLLAELSPADLYLAAPGQAALYPAAQPWPLHPWPAFARPLLARPLYPWSSRA